MRVFTVLVPHLPDPIFHPIKLIRTIRMYDRFPGMVGASVAPEGILLAFATVTHAERAQAEMLHNKRDCGRYIMNADMDREQKLIKVLDPVDGWPEGWVAE